MMKAFLTFVVLIGAAGSLVAQGGVAGHIVVVHPPPHIPLHVPEIHRPPEPHSSGVGHVEGHGYGGGGHAEINGHSGSLYSASQINSHASGNQHAIASASPHQVVTGTYTQHNVGGGGGRGNGGRSNLGGGGGRESSLTQQFNHQASARPSAYPGAKSASVGASTGSGNRGLTTPNRYFGNKTTSEAKVALHDKYGSPRSSRPGATTYFDSRNGRSYNVHSDPAHGDPHVDVRKRGPMPDRKAPLKKGGR